MLPVLLQVLPANSAVRVTIGNSLFKRDRPLEALAYFEQIQGSGNASIDEYLVRGLCLYQGLGRFRDAVALWTHANELAFARARSLGLDDCRFRVLDNAWTRHIGDSAMLDYVIKLGILEGRRFDDTILYLPPGSRVANQFLLDQIAPHIRVVEDPAGLPFDPSAVQALHYDLLGPRQSDGTTAFFWDIAAKTHEHWRQSGKGALLTFPADVEERGWQAFASTGMRRADWFVALHVRERGQSRWRTDIHDIRNADIATYLPAINEVTKRGGWVIRMGDPEHDAVAAARQRHRLLPQRNPRRLAGRIHCGEVPVHDRLGLRAGVHSADLRRALGDYQLVAAGPAAAARLRYFRSQNGAPARRWPLFDTE